MLHHLKKLQLDLLIQLGFTFLILIPFIFIAAVGFRYSSIQMSDQQQLRLELRFMLLLTGILIFVFVRSFRLATKRALQIANEMNESLRKSDERYKAFIQNSSEGIWRFEIEKPLPVTLPVKEQLDHCYKYAYLAECNDACARMYGYKHSSDLVGARLTDMLIPTDPENISYLTKFIESGYNLINTESKEKDKEGNIRYFHNTFIGIIENGLVKRAWGTQRDITKEKEIEQSKENFILNASHELRTPIAGIKGLTMMILEGNFGKVQEPIIKPLKMIDASVEKLNRLTNDILDVIKIDSNKLKFNVENVDLNKVIKEIINDLKPFAQINKVTLSLNQNKNATIHSDKEKVKDVLYNILENAIKFSDKSKVHISLHKDGKYMKISVEDTGIGIAKEDQNKIFTRFQQITSSTGGKPQGTGLGLYMARELAKKLGGDIILEKSQLNKGSTFAITLPINKGN